MLSRSLLAMSEEEPIIAAATAPQQITVGNRLELDVVPFGLAVDSGEDPHDFRTSNPLLRGTLVGVDDAAALADHFVLEVDLDASGDGESAPFEASPQADPRDVLAITRDAPNFPHFEFDPRLPLQGTAASRLFGPTLGIKRIAYRAVAVDAAGVPLRELLASIDDDANPATEPRIVSTPIASAWRFFEFEIVPDENAGPLRIVRYGLADEATSLLGVDTLVGGHEGSGIFWLGGQGFGGVGSQRFTYDPRIAARLHGNFSLRHARIEWTHSYFDPETGNLRSMTGSTVATTIGESIYDPRTVDPRLAAIDSPIYVTVDYRLFAVDPNEFLPDALVAQRSGELVFRYEPTPVSYVTVSLAEPHATPSRSWSAARQIEVIVHAMAGAHEGTTSMSVEFQYADDAPLFDDDGPIDASTPIVRDESDPSSILNPIRFVYDAWGLAPNNSAVRARVRQWDTVRGVSITGVWSPPLILAPLQGPSVRNLEVTTATLGDRRFPLVTGEIAPSSDGQGTAQDVAARHVEVALYFRTHESPTPALDAPPDARVVTDADGRFRYMLEELPSAWSPGGFGYVLARSTTRALDAIDPLPSPWRSAFSGHAPSSLIQLPTLVANSLLPRDAASAAPPSIANDGRWQTRSRWIVGALARLSEETLDFASTRVEFAFDDATNPMAPDGAIGRPDSDGRFELLLPLATALGTEAVTVRARVVYSDDFTQSDVVGPWTSLRLRLLPDVNALSHVTELNVAHEVRQDQGVSVTRLPEVTGRVVNGDGYVGLTAVQVRSAATGQLLAATTTDAGGRFRAPLAGLSPGLVRIDVRAADWDYAAGVEVWGPWTSGQASLDFLFESAAPPPVVVLDVASDTGVGGDHATALALLSGSLASPVAGVRVEWDWGDAQGGFDDLTTVIDGAVVTDDAGRFQFAPPITLPGTYAVRVRSVSGVASATSHIVSAWRSLHYTLLPRNGAPPHVAPLSLALGDGPTDLSQPLAAVTFRGRIVSEQGLAQAAIEFDYDQSDANLPNETTFTDAWGEFRITPTLLAAGVARVRVRARQYDPALGVDRVGPWIHYPQFTYAPSAAEPPAAELLLAGSFRAAETAAEAAYRSALTGATALFQQELANLPTADRATYDASPLFVWPQAPDAHRLVVPSDDQQPAAPRPFPTFDGPVLEFDRDPIYQSDVHAANDAMREAIDDVDANYFEALASADGPPARWASQVAAAQQTYRQAVATAQNAHAQAQSPASNPVFDEESADSLRSQIDDAWRVYRRIEQAASDRYLAAIESAVDQRNAGLASTALSEADKKHAARQDAYDDNCEHPDGGAPIPDSTFWCSGPESNQQQGRSYEKEGVYDASQLDSPPEDLAVALAIYQIDKRFADTYADVLDAYAQTVENAERDRDVTMANALHSALTRIYAAEHALGALARTHAYATRIDQLNDEHALAVALTSARENLASALADADKTRDQAQATLIAARQTGVAAAERAHRVALADAQLAAYARWHAARQTSWTAYQQTRAEHLRTHQVAEAALHESKDAATAEAKRAENHVRAASRRDEAVAVAAAESEKSREAAAAMRTVHQEIAAAHKQRDDALATAWRTRREAFSAALTDYRTNLADGYAALDIEYAEAAHAYGTAMPAGSAAGFSPRYYAYALEPGTQSHDESYVFSGFLGGESAYAGWAYDITVGWWFGELREEIDNADTRAQLDETWHETTAALRRDREVLAADALESLHLERIHAAANYRNAAIDAYHADAVQLADARADFEVGAAHALQDYSLQIVQASATRSITDAQAASTSIVALAAADGTYQRQLALASKSLATDDAAADVDFSAREMNAYLAALDQAGGDSSPWRTFQRADASAAAIWVAATRTLDQTLVLARADRHVAWTHATVDAQMAQASALGAAQVQRASALASAHIAAAMATPITDYVVPQAQAVERHRRDLADADRMFFRGHVSADVAKDEKFAGANGDYERALAQARYEVERPAGGDGADYERERSEAFYNVTVATTEASRERANALAAVRRDWTVAVSDAHVGLVTDLTTAVRDEAERRRDQNIQTTTAVAQAQASYLTSLSSSASTRARSEADANRVNALLDAGAANHHDSARALAEAKLAEARGLARQAYRTALYDVHGAQAAGRWGDASYPAQVALVDANWSRAVAPAHAAQRAAIKIADQGLGYTLAYGREIADVGHAQSRFVAELQQVAVDHARNAAAAQHDAALAIAEATAHGELVLSVAETLAARDLAVASAVRERNIALADAGVEMVADVSEARATANIATAALQVQVAAGELSPSQAFELAGTISEQYTTARIAAYARRNAARVAAEERLHEARQAAETPRAADRRDAQIAYIRDVALAQFAYAVSEANADNQARAATSEIDRVRAEQDFLIDRNEAQQRSEALHAHAVARADADVAFAQLYAAPNVLRARSLAQIEGAAADAAAQRLADEWSIRRYADPQNAELAFAAAAARGHATWIARLAVANQGEPLSPFAAHRVRLAESAAQQAVEQAMLQRNFMTASGRRQTDVDQTLFALASTRDTAHNVSESALASSRAAADRALEVAVASADADWAVAGAEASDHAAEHAAAVLDWQTQVAVAEAAHASISADLLRTHALAESAARKAFADGAAIAVEERDAALAVAQREFEQDQSDIDLAASARDAAAQADWLTAHYQAQLEGLARLVDQLDIPWTRFAQAQGTAEKEAWESLRPLWLDREAAVRTARSLEVQSRSQIAADVATTRAREERIYAQQLALAIAAQATRAASAQRDFALAVVEETEGLRRLIADTDYNEQLAKDAASAQHQGLDLRPFNDARLQAVDAWQNEHVEQERAFRQRLASDAVDFAAATASLYLARTQRIASAQAAADLAATAARYNGPYLASLEVRLAEADFAYESASAQTRATRLVQLANAHPTPWARFAAAQAIARRDQVLLPLAQLARDQRIGAFGASGNDSLAGARRAEDLVSHALGRAETQADALEAVVAQRDAALARQAAAMSWTPPETPQLPNAVTPPTVALPTAVTVGSGILLTVWGGIDDWYYDTLPTDWFIGWYGPSGYSWGDDFWTFSPWLGAAAAADALSPWDASGAYGRHFLEATPYGFAGWTPRYVQAPQAAAALDVDANVSAYESTLAALRPLARAVVAALASSELQTSIAILARTGEVVVGLGAWAAEYQDHPTQELATRYGALAPLVRRNVDLPGGGNWQGRRVREVLEALDKNAADFLAVNLRLRLTDDGSPTSTYRVYEADRQRKAYHDVVAKEVFHEILAGERGFLIEVEIPAALNDVEAATYLLGLVVADVAQGEGATPRQIALLYRSFLTRSGRAEGLANATASLYRLAAEHGAEYARFYLEAIAGATTAGSVVLATYEMDRHGFEAGAWTLAFMAPWGAVFRIAGKGSKVALKVGDEIVAHLPIEAMALIQRSQGVGIDDLNRALHAASSAADVAGARTAIEVFLRQNRFLQLVTHGKRARQLLHAALTEAEQRGAAHLMFANPKGVMTDRAAHHIVPISLFSDPAIGGRLHALGIDLNGVDNGVWLPRQGGEGIVAAIHQANHTAQVVLRDGTVQASYVDIVEQGLTQVLNQNPTRESILALIDTIRQDLLSGKLRLFNELGR